MAFTAQFPGVCIDCDGPIEVGQDINRRFERSVVIIAKRENKRVKPVGYAHDTCPDPTAQDKPTQFQGTDLDAMGY